MKLAQHFFVSVVLIGSFVCVQGTEEDIFNKPVISRVTEDKVEKSQKQFEAEFARAVHIERVLKYGVLPMAVACSYLMRDTIYKFGDTLVGTGQWFWSGACDTARFISSPFTLPVTSPGAPQDVTGHIAETIAQAVVGGSDKVPETVGNLASSLTAEEITKLRALLPHISYIEKLDNSFFEQTRRWLISRSSLVTGFTSALLLNVIGKEYMLAQLSVVVSTQNLRHFKLGSTSIMQIEGDLKARQKQLRNPIGISAIAHMGERIRELSEKLQADVVRIIAFMQAVNAYNDLEIGSVASQTRMLIDEANDMASLLEYKLDEFEHTVATDLAKRQELLKEVVQKTIDFIVLLETEMESFSILNHQN